MDLSNVTADPRVEALVGTVIRGIAGIVQECVSQWYGMQQTTQGQPIVPESPSGETRKDVKEEPPKAPPPPPLAPNRIPTFKTLLALYDECAKRNYTRTFKPKPRARTAAINGLKFVLTTLDIPLNAPYTALTLQQMERLEDIGAEQGKSRATIASWRTYPKSITASWTLPMYKERGWDVEPYKFGKFNPAVKSYVAMPKEKIAEIDDWIAHLNDDGRHRNEFLFCWVMRHLGVRNGDVFSLKWENFAERMTEDGTPVMRHSYLPSKTKDSSGRRAIWDLTMDEWRQIVPYRTSGGDPLIKMYEGLRQRFQRDLNAKLRPIMPPDRNKCLYELRKIFGHSVYVKYGPKKCVQAMGDRFETLEKNYVDTSMPED